MSEWTVHLEFEEGTSSKFWRARVEGKTLYVNYGKIGSNGQVQVKDFADTATATKEYNKLVGEKRRKGYVDKDGGGGGETEELEHEPDDDEHEDEEAPPPPPKKAAAPAAKPPTAKLALDAGGRKVDTLLYLDGKTLRMDSTESYATPDAAKKAYDRLKKMLAGEGYKE
jgi:predicted DNA-binding WGR domain protein